ncbi:hypothetical protein NDU88_001706 [Pleurodeles waltl]|uniref:Uncharacterized protein n=1 Tax=Pleurodeles waltl TaxID=8319 RepID=A0AAV7KTC2_PLEWA|nr:hypothetical protein NDU88_001706 [Pleurodeles waltl]
MLIRCCVASLTCKASAVLWNQYRLDYVIASTYCYTQETRKGIVGSVVTPRQRGPRQHLVIRHPKTPGEHLGCGGPRQKTLGKSRRPFLCTGGNLAGASGDRALARRDPGHCVEAERNRQPPPRWAVPQGDRYIIEEDQVVEQQDDLERMIAHMRAEALKRGKDWLCAKMEEKSMETTEREEETTAPASLTDKAGATERASLPPQKPGRQQRSEGKQARKPTKKARVVIQSTEDETALTPEASRPSAPAEGEHISAIIKECIKSLAPLLLWGDGAGPATEGI